MAQAKQTKHFHTFVGGLNTEVSPLIFPDNTAVDLENMELNVDGSMNRRKGLAHELNSNSLPVDALFDPTTDVVTEHFWRNIAGTDEHLHVVQAGFEMFFWTDSATSFSEGEKGFAIDLRDHVVPTSPATDAEVAGQPIDFSWGRGQCLITHKYLDPFFLTFDVDTDSVQATPIPIRVRDFVGIENGIQNTTLPGTISATHTYNLRNRGWSDAEITDFNSTQSKYPSYNMRPQYARRRENIAGYNTSDGTYDIHTERVASRRFGNGSAKTGKFLANPFANAVIAADADADDNPITDWDHSGGGFAAGVVEIDITTEVAHGLGVGEFVIVEGQSSQVQVSGSRRGGSFVRQRSWNFQGAYVTKTGTTGSNITIDVILPRNFDLFLDKDQFFGVVQTILENPDGADAAVRPTTNAYFAGRAWYAGTPAGVIGQHVLFSQIIQKNQQYGRCYQEADPTDEEAPDIIESDGGIIYIPEAGRILKLQPFGQSMLVFAVNGVWEIDGGANRYFDAIDFAVRRITGTGCISRESVLEAEDNIIYASEEGAYRIFVDPDARVLVANNFTQDKVQSHWSSIDSYHKQSMKTLFDPVKKRLLFMYDTSASPTAPTWNYREVLLYDARLEAWYKYAFADPTSFADDTYIKGLTKPELYAAGGEAIIKILSYTDVSGEGFDWNEFSDSANFEDFGELDAPAFLVTGYEGMGDATKDKQVRYLSTFMGRIENSSLTMRGRWDFADADISGKWSPSVEAYRPPRLWVGDHGDDGYPVVVSKHTVPGQGQVLSVRYDSTAATDAELYGWSIDFQGIQD
jgi:hypothetical protein